VGECKGAMPYFK